MYVSFEVRLQIKYQGRYAMLLRGNELGRRRRVLHPFGGGIKTVDEDRPVFGLDADLDDLRFDAPVEWCVFLPSVDLFGPVEFHRPQLI